MTPARAAALVERAWEVLAEVPDPELPAVSVRDLGIVRDVIALVGGGVEIVLTPTYSGCPATDVIADDVRAAVAAAGLGTPRIVLRRAPAAAGARWVCTISLLILLNIYAKITLIKFGVG